MQIIALEEFCAYLPTRLQMFGPMQDPPPVRILVRDGQLDPDNGRNHLILDEDCASLLLPDVVASSAGLGDRAVPAARDLQLDAGK